MPYLKLQVSFSLNFASLFNSVIRDSSSVLFSWSLTWIGQKKPIKVQNFKLSTALVKFYQICTLIDSFSAKKVQRSYVPWHGKVRLNLTKNGFVVLKMTGIWSDHSKVTKSWILIGSFCAKYITFDLKKVQRRYLSWHGRVMQNLNKTCLVVWKMTWGISQIFTRTLTKVKIGTLMESFCPTKNMHKLKIYTGVMCNNTEVMTLKENWHKHSKIF